jgi:hypothetical protein
MCGQQRIEIGQHVFHALHGLRIRRLECLFDASELGVQHLALQHVLDRLEDLAGLLGSPRVVIKPPNSPSDIIGQRVQLELRQPRLRRVLGRQSLPLGGERLVERRSDLIQDAT